MLYYYFFQPFTFASLDKKIGFFSLPGSAIGGGGDEQGIAGGDELSVPVARGVGGGGSLISSATSSESSESSSDDDDTDTKSERSYSSRQKQRSSAGGRDAIKR